MKFQPGDLVEIVGTPTVAPDANWMRAGLRGTVVEFIGEWYPRRRCWRCIFEGQDMYSEEDYLRKIPPDPGRELVRWNQCDWRPSRSLVEA